MSINNTGSGDAALLCHTDYILKGLNSGGNWFAPDGSRVDGIVRSQGGTSVPGFSRNRGPGVVRLHKTRHLATEGIYCCTVKDRTETDQKIYVGLYYSGNGTLHFSQ